MQRHIAQSALARYGVAVASVALAVVPALWLRPLALAGAQFLLVAVLITGWVSGLRPALVAWALATLAFKYYFTPPFDSLIVDVAELPRLIVFAIVAVLMATVSATRRKAEDALKSARDNLEERVRERTVRFEDLVTKRKRAEYLTEHVFETSPDAVYIVGRDYTYRRVNPVFARRWRLPAEEIVGMPMADLTGKEPFEETYKPNLDRCFAGEVVSFGGWFPTPSGLKYLAATYSPLQPDSERVLAVLAVTRDLTDHVRASEALQEAQAELAHVTRVMTLGELTASIAHEVNQPLAAIVADANASLNWLAASPPDLGSVRQALDAIVKDGHRAADVIQRIRQLATKTSPQKARLEVNDVIRDVVRLIGIEMRSHEVSLRIDLAPALPPVFADRVQLQQVLINLVMNGIEAMASVDGRSRELVIRSQPEDDDHVVVAVQDAGVGIDVEKTDQLFNAFYTTKPDGMGMGLSISRSIIEAHGGRLWATANPDHGATFHFALPGLLDLAAEDER
jgi:PAS domain S-box-containing protein